MTTINHEFKYGVESVFNITQIPELNTDNVSLVVCNDASGKLDTRIINNSTFGLTNNYENSDFSTTITLYFNGVSGYDDWSSQTYDPTKNYLVVSIEVNVIAQKDPFILVNNGDTAVDIYMEKNAQYTYADNRIYHCEGLTEGTYTNTVTVNNNIIHIGTIPAHQKMFMKTTLASLSRIKISSGPTTATYYPINLKFSNNTDWTNITFDGNINALINYYNGTDERFYSSYYQLFKDCTTLKITPNLSNITNLKGSVSDYTGVCTQMFDGCTSLTTVVGFPTTNTAGIGSCSFMFRNCTSLVNVPQTLPATSLQQRCYHYMFQGCTSLVTAPSLPATSIGSLCYGYMFHGCTSLVNVPQTLPATSLQPQCYVSMFYGCSSLVTAPTLPATTLAEYCYYSMFGGCSSLVTAPELPATTLVSNCYASMFSNCSNLNYIKALFTTTPSATYTSSWVIRVASSGTFVKNSVATWNVSGNDGVPSGWTVITDTSQ